MTWTYMLTVVLVLYMTQKHSYGVEEIKEIHTVGVCWLPTNISSKMWYLSWYRSIRKLRFPTHFQQTHSDKNPENFCTVSEVQKQCTNHF